MDADAIRQCLPPWLQQLATDKAQLIISTAIILLLSSIPIRKMLQSRKQRSLETDPGFPPIEPLPDFDWSQTEPLTLRPFKPKYNLTMALESLDPSELIPMDKTYKDRLLYRRSLLHKHRDIVVATHNEDKDPRVRAAVCELYRFLLATYLPRRYPSMFRLHEAATTGTGRNSSYLFENRVMDEMYPAEVPREMTTEQALETILKNVDEDYLILLPDPTTSSAGGSGTAASPDDVQTKYTLYAYETCYPAGFNPREKIGRRLAAIHGPVPGYKAKLKRSMDRFFERIEVGRFVKRVNWGIMAGQDVELFAAFGGLHGSEEDEVEKERIPVGELDMSSTFLRCERQTLHRLPKSRALVFGFHTYTYPIAEIKAEGLGEELAAAIDGLKTGNVPEIHTYKRAPVWADAIKAYLRDEQ